MKKKLRMTGNRVLINPTPSEDVTKSGIIIPDSAKQKPNQGTVRQVGPAVTKDDNPYKVHIGDLVLYGKYSGTEMKIQEEDVVILSDTDILCIIEDGPE